MQALSEMELLEAWERGWAQPPPQRALALLAAALPGTAPQSLAQLPLGRRDAALLRLRERIFGPRMTAWAECPGCRERVEFTFTAAEIGVDPAADDLEEPAGQISETLTAFGCDLEFRRVTTEDLAAIAGESDVELARRSLIRRCILQLRRGELTDAVVRAVSDRMAELDAAADIRLDIACPACDRQWGVPFDVVPYFWAELDAFARRRIQDVHALAATYGWDEPTILAMSPWRRECYLRLVRG